MNSRIESILVLGSAQSPYANKDGEDDDEREDIGKNNGERINQEPVDEPKHQSNTHHTKGGKRDPFVVFFYPHFVNLRKPGNDAQNACNDTDGFNPHFSHVLGEAIFCFNSLIADLNF